MGISYRIVVSYKDKRQVMPVVVPSYTITEVLRLHGSTG